MQSGLTVKDKAITGVLHKLESGALVDDWGLGHFMALAFSDIDPRAASVKVGMSPSQSSGLVELLGDPDMNGVFKVTDKDAQKFVIESRDAVGNVTRQEFDLSGLTLEAE